ncbi:MAG TPA: Rad52/Rad22 family DNA repair protein, partial [Chitinophagales bacterium]|nr:Rad52/Rad22 family DNA repair protein [Chitinophagales bacterium]
MREALRMPLPKEAVKQHPTKTFLSSIKAIYVTERLNDVFGVGSWHLRVNHVTTTDKSMVVVKVEFSIPEYGIYFECYGGNDNGGENSKNFDLGDAYKGATTDALTKIGSYLEIGIDVFKG